jgi:cytochrome c-type biogenesis protein CcmH
MTPFWLIASLLVAIALALLLPPLLRRRSAAGGVSRNATNVAVYRDQLKEIEQDFASGILSRDGYEEAKREIERRVLEDVSGAEADAAAGGGRNAAVVIGAAIPIVAFALYFAVGNIGALLPGRAMVADQGAHGVSEAQIRELTARLAARMEQQPDDVEGWVMLGRSYTALGEFPNAARAYGNAVSRSGSDAALLADYADALAMAQGRSLEGEPEKIIHRALEIDPHNVKALALGGTAAFERKDYAGATQYWARILKEAPEESELAKSVRASIAEAQDLARQSGQPVLAAKAPETSRKVEPRGEANAKGVSGVVQLAPALASKVAPGDTLFVFARAAEGPRMPLAIIRARAADLPLKFTLDDRNAMTQGMRLSNQAQVVVGARISKSGNATPQRGDLEGTSAPVQVGKSDVAVVIDAETK